MLPRDIADDIEKFQMIGYAEEYFKTHRRGIFKRRIQLEKLIQYHPDPLQTSLLQLSDEEQTIEAVKIYKVILKFIGKGPTEKTLLKMSDSIGKAVIVAQLRDEIYCQVIKQTTGNPHVNKRENGWRIFCMLLEVFCPTQDFEYYVLAHFEKHTNAPDIGIYATYCHNRLKHLISQPLQIPRKPKIPTLQAAIEAPFIKSVFRSTIDDIMETQLLEGIDLNIPAIFNDMIEKIRLLGGIATPGIFRIQASMSDIALARSKYESREYDHLEITDPHVYACILKIWMKEIYSPVIPPEYYKDFVDNSKNIDALRTLVENLPIANRAIIKQLISFLRIIAQEPSNRMGTENLSIVLSPNLFRCPEESPQLVLLATKVETETLCTLISLY
eukprot:TRINITY_DN6296_c0_g1_i1.p1 TRINITY_DN6296_c0_g1~~TRINITY_DN6296_c0_g1_i1.p1  ORF type:complete len:386 (-),score=57.01 TRINITY_DN6296_c0_g1_i1:45-1202(-)